MTVGISKQERKRFERWYVRRHCPDEGSDPLKRSVNYPYQYPRESTRRAWTAWRAQHKRHKPIIEAAKKLTEAVDLEDLERYLDDLKTTIADLEKEATHDHNQDTD